MKRLLLSFLFIFLGILVFAQQQTPAVLWSNTFGGSSDEEIYKIIKDKTGGYIAVGYTASSDYDVATSHGGKDLWIVRFNENGDTIWTKTYGGSNDDYGNAVINTFDNCFVIAGYTNSSTGDLSQNYGNYDFWILKIDTNGNILWSKTYGGSNDDEANAIIELPDSNLFVAGYTLSSDSDVYNIHGSDEAWILKLAPNGDTLWTQTYGGSNHDFANAITQLADSSYAIAGYTSSTDGDLSGINGAYDFWVLNIDETGNMLASYTYGGSGDDIAYDIAATPDTGFVIVGYSSSNNGDVPGNYGYRDMWVVRGKSDGNIDWSRNIGGSAYDIAQAVQFTYNKECIIAGYTKSTDYDIHKPHGDYDTYITCLDENGTTLWSQSYGGKYDDFTFSLLTIENHSYFAGYSKSTNGDLYQPNNGYEDIWIAKLTDPTKTHDSITCKNYDITLETPDPGESDFQWYFHNEAISGEIMNTLTIDSVSPNNTGTYYCKINTGGILDTSFFRVDYFKLSVSATTVDPTLYQFDGSIQLNITGDNPPFMVAWGDGSNGNINNNIGLIENFVSIIDSAGCSIDTIIKVNSHLFEMQMEMGVDTFQVSTYDLPSTMWGGLDTLVNAYDTLNGQVNTDSIIKILGEGDYAAYACDTLTEHGITDWFLPAYSQLKMMQQDKNQINNFIYDYWSSTEIDSADAIMIPSSTGINDTLLKDNKRNVRCISLYHTPKKSGDCHIAFYPLDTTYFLDNALDGANDGTFYGWFISSDDRTGDNYGAYQTYPDSGYATLPAILESNKSVSLWFKLETNDVNQPILVQRETADTNQKEIELYVSTAGAVVYSSYDDSQIAHTIKTSDSFIQLHKWYHTVITASELNDTTRIISLYVENALVAIDTFIYPFFASGDYQLGYFSEDSIYDMRLDDINLYTCAIDSSLVDSLYHDKSKGSDENDCIVFTLPLDSNKAIDIHSGQTFITHNTQADTNRFFHPNEAMSFNGTNAYVELDTNVFGPCFSCWIKTAHNYSDTMALYSITDTVVDRSIFWYISNGKLSLFCSDSKTITDTTFIADNKYHHLASKWHSSGSDTIPDTVFIFVDNVLRTIDTINIKLRATHCRLGSHYKNGQEAHFYKGLLDDFNLNTCPAFTDSDIDSMYHVNGWPSDTMAVVLNIYPAPCYDSLGMVEITTSNATQPYTYFWSDGDTMKNIYSETNTRYLEAGTYTVTVVDSVGAVKIKTFIITRPDSISVSTTLSNIKCYKNQDGSINLNVSGGTPNYSFSWMGPDTFSSTNQNIDSLMPGDYYVTIEDAHHCLAMLPAITITEPDSLYIYMYETNPKCHNDSSGKIDITIVGGSPEYTVSWQGPNSFLSSSQNIDSLIAGAYNLTITDTNGCTITENTELTNPPLLTVNIIGKQPKCYGAKNGVLIAKPSGGTPAIMTPYTYNWQGTGLTSIDSVVDTVSAGTYYLTIWDDNSCSVTDTINITQPDSISIVVDSVKKSSGFNGAIYVSVSGGVGTYVYDWDNDGTGDFDDPEDITGLPANDYTLMVQDTNYCTASTTVTVDSINSSTLTISYSQKDVKCYGDTTGEVTVFVTSGTSPYSYRWSTGDSLINTTDTSHTIANLMAGTYTVTVTDGDDSEKVHTFIISESTPIIITATTTTLKCYGDTNASISLDVSGGTGSSYSYLWNTGATTDTIANLSSGVYVVTVTDSIACNNTTEIAIIQPAKLTAMTSVISNASSGSTCDGSATVVATGGSGSYLYSWSDGASQTTDTATGLCANTYMVTVTDTNNCSTTDSVVILIEATPLTISITGTDPQCHGSCNGMAIASVNGGEAPYSYQWDDAEMQTTDTAKSLCAGTYHVTITDHNGLTISDSIVLADPEALDLSIMTMNASCGKNDGMAQVTVTNGSGNYSYEWSNGDVTNRADSLSAGTGTILVTDNGTGCSTTQYFTIENTDAPTLNLTGKNIACNGDATGEINLTITGTAYPYKVMWSNGISTSLSGTTASQMINNLEAGSYEVDVIDTNGCLAHSEIILTENAPISLSFNTVNASCGHEDGSISLNIIGGINPYTVMWDNGDTTTLLTHLLAGNYNVSVSDSNGCSTTGTVAVADSGAPVLTIDTIISARCNQTGAILVTATGVDASATYVWDSTISGEDLTDAEPGNHSLVVNSNGCKAILNATIPYIAPQPQPLCVVSVDSATAANLIVWRKTDTTAIDHYNVYREGSKPGEYFLLGSRSIDSMSYFIDSGAYSWIRSYRYKLSTVDECGNESELSPLHKTVHLTVNLAYTTGTETKVNLIWDDYEGFDYTTFYVSQYSLHDGWKVLDSLPRDLHSYTAVVPEGGAIYVVTVKRPGEACWANRNYSGPYVQSYSNVDDLRANGGGSSDTTSDSTAVNLQNSIGNIALYPNPNDGSFTVTGNHIVAVDIYNANGQLVEQHRTAMVNKVFLKPKTKLTEGIYFVKIMTQNAIVVKKVMVK